MSGLRSLPLKRKLIAIIMGTTVLALILAAASFFAYDNLTFRSDLVRSYETLVATLQGTTTNAIVYNDPEQAQQILGGLDQQPNVIDAAVYDADGKLFSSYARGGAAAPAATRPAGLEGTGSAFTGDALVVHRQLLFRDKPVGTFVVRTDLEGLEARFFDYLKILLLTVAGVSLVAFLISSALQRSVSQPVLDLAKMARDVSVRRDFSVRARHEADDEIGRLAADFNEMLAADPDPRRRAAGGARPCRAGQPRQKRVPRQHEPRAAHPARPRSSATARSSRTTPAPPGSTTSCPTSPRSRPPANTCSA